MAVSTRSKSSTKSASKSAPARVGVKVRSKSKQPVLSKGRSLAARADIHDLYERAVQDPEADVEFMSRIYKKRYDRVPVTLREDFCGTGFLCVEWARSRPERVALGIDLDQATMDWGKRKRLAAAPQALVDRVQLVRANVLDGTGPSTDVACALNFSYCVFKTRAQLREYFAVVLSKLNEQGMFFLDLYGGQDAMIEDETDTNFREFVYTWEQAFFDPLTHETLCHIHFYFPDGSSKKRAFSYDWRLWTVPELRELLHEAGFSRVRVFWERTDEDGDGLGTFYEPKRVENQPCWWTYIVAER